jgi:predicted DNA-binding ribbon-helix-helix protein
MHHAQQLELPLVYRSDLPHSQVIKRSIAIGGRETSVSLEDPFWDRLKAMAAARGLRLCDLVAEIDNARERRNLSSALRLYVLRHASGGSHG